jgi:predicted RNA-binding protein
MCLAKGFLNTKRDQPVLQDVARLRILDGQAEVETLTGETKMILGKIVEIDFMNSSIILDVTMIELNIV